MNVNRTLRDAEFKDESPLKTVKKIKSILACYGIKTIERWNESGVPYCYSIRIIVEGSGFSVNGKGLTKEFALASGYGELMERLQLGLIGSLGVQKDAMAVNRDTGLQRIPVEENIRENARYYKMMTDRFYAFTGKKEDPNHILDRYTDENGTISVLQYYNLSKNKRVYFPYGMHGVYTSNGAAAGNTMEEALVQAISETVERYHKIKVIREGVTLPDIPEEVLSGCKIAHSIISCLRGQGFKVVVKDASLGTKFPVVCVVIIHEHSGRYHTHFGAYPVFEIALQRALTESFQGRNIENIAQFEEFHYNRSQAYAVETLLAEMIRGSAQRHVDFFVGEPKYTYNTNMGFCGKNNQELLRECLAYFDALGYDILARDRSCLGFPTYQVLIPGYSEWAIHRLSSSGDDSRYLPVAIRVFRNPANASEEEMQGLIKYLELLRMHGKTKNGKMTFRDMTFLSAKLPEAMDEQLVNGTMAYVCYALGEYEKAAMYVDKVIKIKGGAKAGYLTCVKRYLNMKANGYADGQIEEVLAFFHSQQAREKLLVCLAEGRNPMEEYILSCDGTCTSECVLCGLCNQKRTEELPALIQRKIGEMKFEDFEAEVQEFLS